jgi:glycosyltransferase involved in cell wall biosynthesis
MESNLTIVTPVFRKEDLEFGIASMERCLNDKIVDEWLIVDDTIEQDIDYMKLPLESHYEKDNIRIIKMGRNKGTMLARIKGAEEVQTPYFFYLDADDRILYYGIKDIVKLQPPLFNWKDRYGLITSCCQNTENQVWRHDGIVGSLIDTKAFNEAITSFIMSGVLANLVKYLGTNHICVHEDEFLYRWYKAWMFNNKIAHASSHIVTSIYNFTEENRKTKESYQGPGGVVNYEEGKRKEEIEWFDNELKRYWGY